MKDKRLEKQMPTIIPRYTSKA